MKKKLKLIHFFSKVLKVSKHFFQHQTHTTTFFQTMAYTNTEIETQMHSFDQYISSADLSAKPHQTRAVSWCLKKELATEPSFGVRGGLIVTIWDSARRFK